MSGNTGKNEVIAERIMQSNKLWKHSLDNIIRHCFHTNKTILNNQNINDHLTRSCLSLPA